MRLPHLPTTLLDSSKFSDSPAHPRRWSLRKQAPEAWWALLVLATAGSGCWLGSGELSDALGKGDDDTAGAGVPELCNGVDDDGDGEVDEADAVDALTWFLDADGDTFGALGAPSSACVLPEGYVADASDCDDSDIEIYPGAAERCNGTDDDCDRAIDEDVVTPTEDISLSVTHIPASIGVPITFQGIGAGCFQMGCTPGDTECAADENPAHTVRLTRSFYLMETAMTQSQFFALTGLDPSYRDGDDLPVEKVTWHMAAAAANALSKAEHFDQCYTCMGWGHTTRCKSSADPYACEGYRLPTEAEWEYAARCGEGTVYAGSDDANLVAWTNANSGGKTQVVGALKENGCGLYDMGGNVSTWVDDWYSLYVPGFLQDPVGSPGSEYRGVRGGTWFGDPSTARVSYRSLAGPWNVSADRGLRLARTMDPAGFAP